MIHLITRLTRRVVSEVNKYLDSPVPTNTLAQRSYATIVVILAGIANFFPGLPAEVAKKASDDLLVIASRLWNPPLEGTA